MRAAVLTGPGQVRVIDVPRPDPGPGQVRVRLEGCGVCASNLGPWAGPDWMRFPTEPGGLGHEGWGTIDALGEGLEGISPGQRVAAIRCLRSSRSACGMSIRNGRISVCVVVMIKQ